MALFKPVYREDLQEHFDQILPIVKKNFVHVTEPYVNIPGFTEGYLVWRNFIRKLKGEENKSVHIRIRDEFVRKYSPYFPTYIVNALVDYSIYRYFVQKKELRPALHIEFAEDVIRDVEKNRVLLLNNFSKQLYRERVRGRDSAMRSFSRSSHPAIVQNRRQISDFVVGTKPKEPSAGKKKRTQKKGKGKRRKTGKRKSKTGKRRR
tara:strand:+ start:4960 stop:5577 length:618 start_codon:yes stop_codon:yes gene_type:complete